MSENEKETKKRVKRKNNFFTSGEKVNQSIKKSVFNSIEINHRG